MCRGAFGRGGRFAPGFAPNATALDSEVVAAPGRVEAVPRRWTQGLSGKELPPAPMNGAIVRKLRHPGESAPFDSLLVAMADDSLLRVRLDVDGRLARRSTRRPED